MQRASSRKKEVFMKNKSEFFIKHYNYANNYIHIRSTCQVLLTIPSHFMKFFITLTDFACSMISKRFSDM